MKNDTSYIEKSIKAFCAQIGADPALVQGAGGNVSWKEGDTLWVKASGAWLAEADFKEIFIPVNLSLLQEAISRRDFSVKPIVINNSEQRPSIETLLHALMPHKVVVHLHAIEILAHLVRVNAKYEIETYVGDAVNWVFVDYVKPGEELAKEVHNQLTNRLNSDVVFLGNHGIVIGGSGVEEILDSLNKIIIKLKNKVTLSKTDSSKQVNKSNFLAKGYIPCVDKEVNSLSINNMLNKRLRHEWALYPDHVVFLGSKAAILEKNFSLNELEEVVRNKPPFIFSIDDGVYENLNASAAQKIQLRCYYDVIARLGSSDQLNTLSDSQVAELLDWDAEKYRQLSTDDNRKTR